jgi:hypothetical protein
MRILNALREWWARPSEIERIYAATSYLHWRPASELQDAAGIFTIGRFYTLAERLEIQGRIISRYDDGPIAPARQGRRVKLYRRVAP